jgi:hypothetical protein
VVFGADDQGPLSARRWITYGAVTSSAPVLGRIARREKGWIGREPLCARPVSIDGPGLSGLRWRAVEKADALGTLFVLNFGGAQRF